MMEENDVFNLKPVKPEEIDKFVHDHIQSKIDHGELEMSGFDMENVEIFEKQLDIYQVALFEGICNGILWCGGTIEGVDTSEADVYKTFDIGNPDVEE